MVYKLVYNRAGSLIFGDELHLAENIWHESISSVEEKG